VGNIKLFITVSPPSDAVMGFALPYEGNRMATWRNFICDVPGMQFAIAVGQRIPRDLTVFSFSEKLGPAGHGLDRTCPQP
jgi:hypothetical protein